MIARYGLGAFEFSQNYCFFWDQLEKANLFLQGVIDTRDAPREDGRSSGCSRTRSATAASLPGLRIS